MKILLAHIIMHSTIQAPLWIGASQPNKVLLLLHVQCASGEDEPQ